jgi:hypothetical protein
MNIQFPSDTDETIDSIRNAIGRNVTFHYKSTSTPCPDCSLDPSTDTSTNSFCQTCGGYYWIPVYSDLIKKAHILWGQMDILNWVSAGKLYDGDCRIQVKYEDDLLTILPDVKYVVVDGKHMEIKKKEFRGVPEINRIILYLIPARW